MVTFDFFGIINVVDEELYKSGIMKRPQPLIKESTVSYFMSIAESNFLRPESLIAIILRSYP